MSSIHEFPPARIAVLTPSLATSLRERANTVLSYIVRTNSLSRFFDESEILSDFRGAIKLNGQTDILQTFHDSVHLSVYENYRPFVSRLFEEPCKLSSIENLMSPGFPGFIAHSAGTSSGSSNPVSESGGKNCIVYSLGYRQVVEGVNEEGDVNLKMPVCLMSTGTIRMHTDMHVDKDPFLQGIRVPDHSSPLAASFISNYKSFLFIHVLFSLYEPQVELINTMFSTIFRDFCRTVDENWDTFTNCIETGTIPDLVGVEHLRENLLKFLPPNPARAAELCKIGRDAQSHGWFTKIWPGLRVVVAISSGPFQTVVPEIRHYIGPDVQLQTLGINCSEAFLALAYDHRDPSLYKVVGSDDIVEFLPTDAPEEARYVAQTWNVEVGGKYEVVLTTRDGLWRYRLGDVVEVVGFDPRDGQPIIHYVERRGVYIRLANEIVSGQELLDALNSVSDSFGVISEFCVSPDFRESIPRYCFFVEPLGENGKSLSIILSYIVDACNPAQTLHVPPCRKTSTPGKLAVPVVRVLRQGTFGEYRDWKALTSGTASVQTKVPTVVWDETLRDWLAARVVQEF
ncbi:GH3 auxin-responsive promoter [Chiua virens]|nr:GH3 auxin-responsive promoter [Chiua virens]